MKSINYKSQKTSKQLKTFLLSFLFVCLSFYTVSAQEDRPDQTEETTEETSGERAVSNDNLIIQRPSGNLGLKLKNTSAGTNSPHFTFDARSSNNSVDNIFLVRQEGDKLSFRKFANDGFDDGRLLMTMRADGNIGVLAGNPQERFHVNGNVRSDRQFIIRGIGNDTNRQSVFGGDGGNHRIELRSGNTPYIDFKNNSGATTEDFDARLILESNNVLAVQGATLAINTSTAPSGYKLAVNGKMIATSLKIQEYNNWPDYVFENDYALTPLADVEAFIKTNKHLPNVPSAAQVTAEEGFDVAVINKVLLEKVEELTLYTIAQEKKIEAQQLQLQKVVGKINELLIKE